MAGKTPVGERGVSATGLVAVPLLRAAAGVSAPGWGGRLPPPLTWAGARAAPPSCSVAAGEGVELTLSSRLGSLTQIRGDKESRGLVWRHKPGRSQGGEVVDDSADCRICTLKSRTARFLCTLSYVVSQLRVKWVRRLFCSVEARPWNPSYSMRNLIHFLLYQSGEGNLYIGFKSFFIRFNISQKASQGS